MSTIRITSWLAVVAALAGLAPAAMGQRLPRIHPNPFAFPQIDTDAQFFAPADVDPFGGGPPIHTGWFGAYERVYMNVSRPELAFETNSEFDGDFTWGNRFDIGYVDDEYNGWTFTGWHIDGPNVNDEQITERINRTESMGTPDNMGVNPQRDNNNRRSGDRDYFITNSINVADLSAIELNRTWMLEPLHYGGRIEPLVGFKFSKFVDHFRRDTYRRFDTNGVEIFPLDPKALQNTVTTEFFTSQQSGWTNYMVGGQVGVNWYKDYRRWHFFGTARAFGLQNFQIFNQITVTENTVYPGAVPETDNQPDTVLYDRSGMSDHNAEFVVGFGVRAEAAYEVTRDFNLRVGFELMDFEQGIARGNIPNFNNEELLIYGVTFGASLNR